MAFAFTLAGHALTISSAVAQTTAPTHDGASPRASSDNTAPGPAASPAASPALSPAASGATPTEARPRGLKIASWNLNDAAGAGVITRTKQKRRTWRNTFTPRQRRQTGHGNLTATLTATLAGADIVLMQGVRNIREARKLFPARYWKLIVSRQILKVRRGRSPFPSVMPEGFETTAIAVRYQLGVRVTGQQHLLGLAKVAKASPPSSNTPADNNASAADDTKPPAAPATPPQAGLAIRVLYHGRMVWLVSVALGDSCVPNKDCPSHATLKDWITDKRDYEDKVILAGHFRQQAAQAPIVTPAKPEAPVATGAARAPAPKDDDKKTSSTAKVATAPCARQDIRLVGGTKEKVRRVAEAGCIAIVTLHK